MTDYWSLDDYKHFNELLLSSRDEYYYYRSFVIDLDMKVTVMYTQYNGSYATTHHYID